MVAWRRHLHRYPELGFREEETSRFVWDKLRSFGGFELSRPTPTSVVARLVGGLGGSGRVIALRADMDALPIQEENDHEYASLRAGVMHACGHDGHTAYLLGAAKVLAGMRGDLRGEILFVFQPDEEGGGGARAIVETGVLEGVDAMVGTHLAPRLPVGEVGLTYGPSSASVDNFKIVVEGVGGHAAKPHQAVDPVAVAAQVVTNLQHLISRETDPLDGVVVSVTKIHGGTTTNVIPPRVEMEGTARSLSEGARAGLPEKMGRIARGIAGTHGASCAFEYRHGPGPVINDEATTAVVESSLKQALGAEAVTRISPSMGGEDFSSYRKAAPGTFVNVGAGNEEKGIIYPNHHPRFDIDEDALPVGVKVFVCSTLGLLAWEGATGDEGA